MMTDDRARQRSYYCSAKQQAIIVKRAKKAGMSRSAFMVACALHDDPVGTETMAAPDELRALLDHLPASAEVVTRLMAPVPDLGMSVVDALEFLCRLKAPESGP
ncbi:MAG: hypothetical protein OXQ84_10555 [bacterium]|nr:hypothetical protein [bacterium]